MAELKKVNDFHYEAPEMDQPTVATDKTENARGNTTCPHSITQKKLKCLFTRKINRCCISLCNDWYCNCDNSSKNDNCPNHERYYRNTSSH